MYGFSGDGSGRNHNQGQRGHNQRHPLMRHEDTRPGNGQSGWEAHLAPLYAAAESVGAGPLFEQIMQQGEIAYGSQSRNPLLAGDAVGHSAQYAPPYYAEFPGLTQETIATPEGPLTYTVLGSRPPPQGGDDLARAEFGGVLGYPHSDTAHRAHHGMHGEGHLEYGDMPAGMIFGCKEATKGECLRRQIFGLPRVNADVVTKIKPGAKLFLFNFDTRELYGIFEAVTSGGLDLDPRAFGGNFPAQVRFAWSVDCPPLPEDKFMQAIKDNYYKKGKFKFDLNSQQVSKLKHLFNEALRAATGRTSSSAGGASKLPFNDTRDVRDKRDKRDSHDRRDGREKRSRNIPSSDGVDKSLLNSAPRVSIHERIRRPPVHQRLGPRIDRIPDLPSGPFDGRGRKGPFGEYSHPDIGPRGRDRPFPEVQSGLLGPTGSLGPFPHMAARGGYGLPPSGPLHGLRPGKFAAPSHGQRGMRGRDGTRLGSSVAVVGRGGGNSSAILPNKKPGGAGTSGSGSARGAKGKERERVLKDEKDKGKKKGQTSEQDHAKQKSGSSGKEKVKVRASGSSAPAEVKDEKKEEKKKKEGRSVVTGWPAAPAAKKLGGREAGAVKVSAGKVGTVGTKRKDAEKDVADAGGVKGAERKSGIDSAAKKVKVENGGAGTVPVEDKAIKVEKVDPNGADAGEVVGVPLTVAMAVGEEAAAVDGKVVAECPAALEPGDGEDEDVDIDGIDDTGADEGVAADAKQVDHESKQVEDDAKQVEDDAKQVEIELSAVSEPETAGKGEQVEEEFSALPEPGRGGEGHEVESHGEGVEAPGVASNVKSVIPMEEDVKNLAVDVSPIGAELTALTSVEAQKSEIDVVQDKKAEHLEVKGGEKTCVADEKAGDLTEKGLQMEVEVGSDLGMDVERKLPEAEVGGDERAAPPEDVGEGQIVALEEKAGGMTEESSEMEVEVGSGGDLNGKGEVQEAKVGDSAGQ
eukprot:TRINITY_DN11685_c0_g1_i1.p1 TRINITY_DN11685_c0_g1~~TRINITY_DN11685_c0_g1_i1.p1  ORF type:complete len:988 (-),score=291.04 TRINITY_DN11685_c0_g1_i1:923-3832(-)